MSISYQSCSFQSYVAMDDDLLCFETTNTFYTPSQIEGTPSNSSHDLDPMFIVFLLVVLVFLPRSRLIRFVFPSLLVESRSWSASDYWSI
jgi:hypothetical protein